MNTQAHGATADQGQFDSSSPSVQSVPPSHSSTAKISVPSSQRKVSVEPVSVLPVSVVPVSVVPVSVVPALPPAGVAVSDPQATKKTEREAACTESCA